MSTAEPRVSIQTAHFCWDAQNLRPRDGLSRLPCLISSLANKLKAMHSPQQDLGAPLPWKSCLCARSMASMLQDLRFHLPCGPISSFPAPSRLLKTYRGFPWSRHQPVPSLKTPNLNVSSSYPSLSTIFSVQISLLPLMPPLPCWPL